MIKSRYLNLNDYKNNIINRENLPTFVNTILTEIGFYNHLNIQQQQQQQQQQRTLASKSINNNYQHSSSCSSTTTSSPFTFKQSDNSVFLFDEMNKFNDLCGQDIYEKKQQQYHNHQQPQNVFIRDDYQKRVNNKSTPKTPINNLAKFSNFTKTPTDYNESTTDNDDNVWSPASTAARTPNIYGVISPPTKVFQRPQQYVKQHHLSSGTQSSSSPPSSLTDTALLFRNIQTSDYHSSSQDEASYSHANRFVNPTSILNQRQYSSKFNNSTDIWANQQTSKFNNNSPQRYNNSYLKPTTSNFNYINGGGRSRHSSSNVDSLYNDNVFLSSPNIPNDCEQWEGILNAKSYPEIALYSRKVFIGGVPWDCENHTLQAGLNNKYGGVKLENPGKDQKHPRTNKMNDQQKPGYTYAIFDNEQAVRKLISECRREVKNGAEHYYYRVSQQQQPQQSNKSPRSKEIEIVPWNLDDTCYVHGHELPSKIDNSCTIFVGGLHGMLNAQGLAKIMSETFGEVIHSGLDTDKHKYPIGSGRVTFRHKEDYIKAINSKHLLIKANQGECGPSPKFVKKVRISFKY